ELALDSYCHTNYSTPTRRSSDLDGIYKSTDGGTTWRHLGLTNGLQIPGLVVDPRDPHRVFAAVLGSPYGPNVERGVYRSTFGPRSEEHTSDLQSPCNFVCCFMLV